MVTLKSKIIMFEIPPKDLVIIIEYNLLFSCYISSFLDTLKILQCKRTFQFKFQFNFVLRVANSVQFHTHELQGRF